MKKQILSALVLPAVMVFFVSCKKESVHTAAAPNTDQIINVKIAPNQSYQLDMSGGGNLTISGQAAHSLISEAAVNNETGNQSYHYVPATGFTGMDEVLLLSTKTVTTYSSNSSGECHNGSNNTGNSSVSISYITLKITIGQ